jgi:hypothetical protein
MKTLLRIIGVLMVVGGLAGAMACTWALIDPSIMSPMPPGAFDAPSPRWRAAFGLVFSIAMLLFGSGKLRHRELP